MAQQINLYSPIFRKQPKVFSALTMLQGLALIVVVVAVFFGVVSAQTSLLEIRARLGDAVLVEYVRHDSRLFAVTVNARRARLFPLVPAPDAAREIELSTLESDLEYWRNRLCDVPPLELPSDLEPRVDGSHRGARYSLELPAEIADLEMPVVYHLLGRVSPMQDYVVTEEDALEFVHSLQASGLPVNLLDAFDEKPLLIIGCSFPGWLVRFFIRAARRSSCCCSVPSGSTWRTSHPAAVRASATRERWHRHHSDSEHIRAVARDAEVSISHASAARNSSVSMWSAYPRNPWLRRAV